MKNEEGVFNMGEDEAVVEGANKETKGRFEK